MNHADVVIVGAGHAGAQCAVALRQAKFTGTIALVGDEPELPYERPPLSKEYMSGVKAFEHILLRPAQAWQDRNVELVLGRRVIEVDPVAHRVLFGDGSAIEYRRLVWAAGGQPRKLNCPGHDLQGVHVVRNRADVDRIMQELPTVSSAVVVGGGYIGLEAASVLTQLGKRVTVLEALDRVLARVAGEALSRFFEAEHRRHGVDLRTRVKLERLVGENGRIRSVQLEGGEQIPADLVIVGIGIIPAVEPLIAAGAKGGNGVEVDAHCRTSLPDVYAIGDCAAHANRYAAGATVRLESVQNANDQAAVAAKTIAGETVHYDSVPWFWSNQFDLKLQTVGLSSGHDQCVVRGDPAARSFSVVYLKQGKVMALDCVNAVKDYVQGRKLVVDHIEVSAERLANCAEPLWQKP